MTDPTRIDLIRPDAPALAAFGPYPVGVETLELIHPGQVDVMDPALSRRDRRLVVELWYPAVPGAAQGETYATILRDGVTPVALRGRAGRAVPQAEGAFALVILSHGYPGNRMLMAHLGENLASKGYVVASIDHKDSTYDDKTAFASTLLNRPLDTAFVIDALSGRAQTDAVAIIGYSMGGYGALISGGAALDPGAGLKDPVVPGGLLARHSAPRVDPRLKAIVPIGPWGRQRGYWQAGGMAQMTVPALIMAGSLDEVSGYETGMRAIFDETRGAERHLLTFEAAGHNAAAPHPAPPEGWAFSEKLGFAPFEHYADAVWDTVRMNNIAQHFVTAFLGLHLKGEPEMAGYLSADFRGFAPLTVRGLRWESRARGA